MADKLEDLMAGAKEPETDEHQHAWEAKILATFAQHIARRAFDVLDLCGLGNQEDHPPYGWGDGLSAVPALVSWGLRRLRPVCAGFLSDRPDLVPRPRAFCARVVRQGTVWQLEGGVNP